MCITLAFTGSVLALGKPDFSGTWMLDTEKSDMGSARPGVAGGAKVTIAINQTPTTLSTTRQVGKGTETAVNRFHPGHEKRHVDGSGACGVDLRPVPQRRQ